MTRLDMFIDRMVSQRACLDFAIAETALMDGPVFELGLGNGRTYDHLREILPDRRIWVIDRSLNCHPSCVPPKEDFLEGEAGPMLDQLAEKGVRLALAHYDFGFGVKDQDVAEAARLSPAIAKVMAPGGILVSGQPLVGFTALKGPDTIAPDRYLFYRHDGEN